jgi:hypothetical protein
MFSRERKRARARPSRSLSLAAIDGQVENDRSVSQGIARQLS